MLLSMKEVFLHQNITCLKKFPSLLRRAVVQSALDIPTPLGGRHFLSIFENVIDFNANDVKIHIFSESTLQNCEETVVNPSK